MSLYDIPERLAVPQYTLHYNCKQCGHAMLLDVSVYLPIRERVRELETCNECGSNDISIIPPEEKSGVFVIGYNMSAARELKKVKNSKFAERLQQIHDNSPGSNLKSSSTIVDIK